MTHTELPFTFKEVVQSLPAEKRRSDGTISKYLHRPLSFPLTLVFLKCGWSANAVTWLSILCSVIALGLSLFPYRGFHYAAVGLYLFFGTLDCVDGNMARILRARMHVKNTKGEQEVSSRAVALGEWVDALGGYITWTCILFSMGISAVYFSGSEPVFTTVIANFFPFTSSVFDWIATNPLIWLGLAGVASSANLLARLIFQSWRVASGETSRSSVAGEKRFSEEIGITGWLQILYLAALVLGFVPVVLMLYTAVFCAACVFTLFTMTLKSVR